MKNADLGRLVDGLATRVRDFVLRRTDPLASRVSALEGRVGALSMLMGTGRRPDAPPLDLAQTVVAMEKRIAELEARPTMMYCGVWTEGTDYRRGDLVTHNGSMWHAWQATRDKPGTSEAWQLAVKRGRDAR